MKTYCTTIKSSWDGLLNNFHPCVGKHALPPPYHLFRGLRTVPSILTGETHAARAPVQVDAVVELLALDDGAFLEVRARRPYRRYTRYYRDSTHYERWPS